MRRIFSFFRFCHRGNGRGFSGRKRSSGWVVQPVVGPEICPWTGLTLEQLVRSWKRCDRSDGLTGNWNRDRGGDCSVGVAWALAAVYFKHGNLAITIDPPGAAVGIGSQWDE